MPDLKKMLKNAKRKLFGTKSQDKISQENIADLREKGVTIGENCHIYGSRIDAPFGRLISIGDNVTITNATVLAHDASTNKFLGKTKLGTVTIGSNVFVGFGAIILPNTTIGDNVIVGAGAVVRGHIPSDAVVTGNPAKIIGSCSEYIEKQEGFLKEGEVIADGDIARAKRLLEEGKKVFV